MHIKKFNESWVDGEFLVKSTSYGDSIEEWIDGKESIKIEEKELNKLKSIFEPVILGKNSSRFTNITERVRGTNGTIVNDKAYTLSIDLSIKCISFYKYDDDWYLINIRETATGSMGLPGLPVPTSQDLSFFCDGMEGVIHFSKILKGEVEWGDRKIWK
jgi:hypothetical protein